MQETPVHCSRVCTPPYLSTGISNLLLPAQAEVVMGQLSTYLASWVRILDGNYILVQQLPQNHRKSYV
jgi:hypothetical protein